MIFHNIYTITIGRFAEMMETGDISLVCKYSVWLPKKILTKRYTKLIIAFNNLTNEKTSKKKVNESFSKLSVNYQLMYFEALEKMISIWYKTLDKGVRKDIDELFKMKYGKTPDEKDFLRIPKDKKMLIERATQVYYSAEENKKVDFEADIISLENILAPITIRDKKLYTYNKYVNLALKKVN